MKNIVIVAKVKVKEAFKDEILNELKELHKSTHALDIGVLQYDLHQDLEDSNSFTFIETWENQELLDAHMQKEHFLTFVQKIDGKLENLEITKLEKLI